MVVLGFLKLTSDYEFHHQQRQQPQRQQNQSKPPKLLDALWVYVFGVIISQGKYSKMDNTIPRNHFKLRFRRVLELEEIGISFRHRIILRFRFRTRTGVHFNVDHLRFNSELHAAREEYS